MATTASTYTPVDLAYLRATFRTLDDACAGRPETPDEIGAVRLANR